MNDTQVDQVRKALIQILRKVRQEIAEGLARNDLQPRVVDSSPMRVKQFEYGDSGLRSASMQGRKGDREEKGTGYFSLGARTRTIHNTPMPRGARDALGGYCYHVLNRGNGRHTVFRKAGDFATFSKLLREASERVDVRLIAFCLMPNHFHLALWPRRDGDLSAYMMWLMTAHVRRYHQHHHSSGHVWQGRYRSFPIQEDNHLLTVHRYIERNPVRAGLVERAEDWLWSSAAAGQENQPVLDPGPVPRPARWLTYVNQPQTEAEVERLRECLRRRRPYGDEAWTVKTARRMDLEASLRPRGRPRKKASPERTFCGVEDPRA